MPKQKVLISARSVFSHTPTDGSLEVLFYHRQSANALLLTTFFPLPSVRHSRRSPIHVGSAEGLTYHRHTVNASLLTIPFFLPTCATVGEKSFVWFFGFIFVRAFTQAIMIIFYCKSVCELRADSVCCELPASSACPQALIVVFTRQFVCGLCAGLTCCC